MSDRKPRSCNCAKPDCPYEGVDVGVGVTYMAPGDYHLGAPLRLHQALTMLVILVLSAMLVGPALGLVLGLGLSGFYIYRRQREWRAEHGFPVPGGAAE